MSTDKSGIFEFEFYSPSEADKSLPDDNVVHLERLEGDVYTALEDLWAWGGVDAVKRLEHVLKELNDFVAHAKQVQFHQNGLDL